ncbi:MAG TPA: hypothetical protein VL068_01155, partial [Microthrixaceae bacterium]|nr:hypothetical protein [Microthrixaceae bacterium]
EAWAKKHKTLKLSKVDVAYRLLDQKLTLTPTGKRALITLHSKFTAAFKANDNGTPSAQNPQPGRK